MPYIFKATFESYIDQSIFNYIKSRHKFTSKPYTVDFSGPRDCTFDSCVGDLSMYHIGILSKQGKPLNIAYNEIRKSPFFKPKVFTDSFSLVKALKNGAFDALIILTDEFKPSHIKIIQQVKKRFNELPVMVITEKPSLAAKIKLVDYHKTILLNLGTETKDINGIIIKLINDMHVIPRLSNRYKTAQPARFKIEAGRTHSAYMLDVAKDGACFRIFNKHLSKGQKVRIEVPLSDLKKTHMVQGLVVWQKLEKLKNEPVATSQKVGIRFL